MFRQILNTELAHHVNCMRTRFIMHAQFCTSAFHLRCCLVEVESVLLFGTMPHCFWEIYIFLPCHLFRLWEYCVAAWWNPLNSTWFYLLNQCTSIQVISIDPIRVSPRLGENFLLYSCCSDPTVLILRCMCHLWIFRRGWFQNFALF